MVATRTDEEIARELRDILNRDSRIDDPTRITVEATGGKVTLTGGVATDQELRAAQEDARKVPGVVEVDSQLVVALVYI